MTVLILALIAGLFVLGGVLGGAAYGLTSLLRLVWRSVAPHRTRSAELTAPVTRHAVAPTSAH